MPSHQMHLRSSCRYQRNFYGVQFHPEVHHTTKGLILFDNFLKIAGFNGDWTMKAYQEMIHKLKI